MAVPGVPSGYHTVTPYLVVKGVEGLLAFTKKAFGAREKECVRGPDGAILHAEVDLGDSVVMMGEARGDCAPVPAMLYLYVPDADAVHRKAVSAGATSVSEPADQFYGDRAGAVKDSFGNSWWIATRKEQVSAAEIAKRLDAKSRAT